MNRKTKKKKKNRKEKSKEGQLWILQWPNSWNCKEKAWTCLRNGNFKWETKSLLIAAENNAINTNYVKSKIDYTQKNTSVDYVEKDMEELIL